MSIGISIFCIYIKKKALAQVFSCEFCEISKKTFYYRTPLVAASGNTRKIFQDIKLRTLAGNEFNRFFKHFAWYHNKRQSSYRKR